MSSTNEYYQFENLPENINVTRFWNGIIRSPKLKASELRLYFIIYSLRNCPSIYISRKELAERIGGRSLDKISTYINTLCDIGLLEKKSRHTAKGRFTTNIYSLTNPKEWANKNGNLGWTAIYPDIVTCPLLNDNEVRLYMVIMSWKGLDPLERAISQLVNDTNIDKKTLLKVRKSLIEKGLISYERQGSVRQGNLSNIYTVNDEEEWFASQYQ